MAERPDLLELLERSWLSPIDLIGKAARATTGDLLFPAERLAKFRQQRAQDVQRAQDEQLQLQLKNPGKQRLQIGNKVYD